jgi:myo-inositol 2-dehydrogenase/D-chiro-inositol 1-dehydrogenase
MTDSTTTSRRDFLKTTAVVTGAALTANIVAERMAHAAGSDEMKIALIGCGGRGSGALGQALNTSNSVSLIAVADAFEDNATGALNRYKKDHGPQVSVKDDHVFHGFEAYERVLGTDANLVILATPPGFRPIHFEAAVKAGKNIFTEKPVGTDGPGIRRFLAASDEATKKNLKVGVGLQRHHDPKYQEIVKRIHDGDIGDVILLRVYWNGTRPWVRPRKEGQSEMEFQMRNWYYFTWLNGDHIVEQHIHNLDVANWVMKGPPEMAQGTGGRQLPFGPNQGEIFDHHMIEYTYPNGTKMLSMCRHQPNTWNAVSEYAHGTKGMADLSGGRIQYTDGRPEWKYQKKGGGTQDPYQIEHNDLFAAIRNNTPYNEGPYGASSTMTAILGRMATYSGQEIRYADALEHGLDLMPKQFDWKAEPPVKPGPDGLYACAIPGETKVLTTGNRKGKKA